MRVILISTLLLYSECYGQGSRKRNVSNDINIPKGADTGTILRVPKMGHGAGDLLVNLKVAAHKYFKREGADIHTTKMLSISQAVLGATIEVPTIYGKRTIKIDPGTHSESQYKIPGYGLQRLYPNQHSKGDHYVHFKIKIPSFLNHKQREAMKAYANTEDPIISDEPDI